MFESCATFGSRFNHPSDFCSPPSHPGSLLRSEGTRVTAVGLAVPLLSLFVEGMGGWIESVT